MKKNEGTMRRTWAAAAGIAAVALLAPARAHAAPADGGGAADVARLQSDVDRLKQELRDQRQLIFQLMSAEQQRYDVILKYLQGGGGEGAPAFPPPPSPSSLSKPAAEGEGRGRRVVVARIGDRLRSCPHRRPADR